MESASGEIDIRETKAFQDEIQARDKRIADLEHSLEEFSRAFRQYKVPSRSNENTLRLGIYGDTQVGSRYARLDALREYYRIGVEEGVHAFLNTGDVLDGEGIYKGQKYDQCAHGFDQQMELAVEELPDPKGIPTYAIAGNHDSSMSKTAGVLPVKELARRLDGWTYLGQDMATVSFETTEGPVPVTLLHPDGGTPYAISYRTQQVINSLSGGRKPMILGIGHLHKADHLPSYRNIIGLLTGCFQSQTPFMVRKNTPAHLGGWIIELTLGGWNHLTVRVRAEWIGFMEPKLANEEKFEVCLEVVE